MTYSRILSSLFFCFFASISLLSAQIVQNLTPEWETSQGNHDHTSRDQLHFSTKDNENNIILVSSVERDSTFSDIFIQKVSMGGAEIWQLRYSSGLGTDYDLPKKVMIASNNDMYILCSAFHLVSDGYGYILKIDSNGVLQWVKEMSQETVAHDFFNFFDAYLDEAEQLKVTYSCRSDFLNTPPTYFMTINAAGVVTNKFQKTGIAQPIFGIAYGISEFQDTSGNFAFILRDVNSFHKYYLRRIHPETGADEILVVSDQLLPPEEKTNMQYIDWEFIKQSDNGDIFVGTNYNPFDPIFAFYLLRMNTHGVVQYIKGSQTHAEFASFQDFFPIDSTVIITGLFTNSSQYNTFVWKLDSEGVRTQDITLSQNGTLIPQRLIAADSTFYVHAINAVGHNAHVFKLTRDLEQIWTHTLDTPAGFDLAGSGILLSGPDTIVACGTLRAMKHDNSLYFSEEDVFVEQFTQGTGAVNWQLMHNDVGTTYVLTSRHAVDDAGNILVVTAEKTGPEAGLSGGSTFAPSKYYLYKYNPAGDLLWTRNIPHQINTDYFYKIANTDQAGNIYLPCFRDGTTHLLVKVSGDGSQMDSLAIQGGIGKFLVSNNNEVHIISNGISIVDADFSDVQIHPIEGFSNHIFQLPGSDDTYVFAINNDSVTWQVAPRISLYKNGVLVWKYTLPSQMFHSVYIVHSANNPQTGLLYFESYDATVNMLRLHRINLDGSNPVSVPLESPYNGEMHCLNNGNFYLYTPDKLFLYDANLTPVIEHPLTSISYAMYTSGAYLYAFENGSVNIFDSVGNYKAKLFHPEFEYSYRQNAVYDNSSIYTIGSQGGTLGGGYNFGWRWYRSLLKKFDIDLIITGLEQPETDADDPITCFPNPVSQILYVSVPGDFLHQEVQLNIIDLHGRVLKSMDTQHCPPSVGLDCSALVAGQYVLQCVARGGVRALSFQKY